MASGAGRGVGKLFDVHLIVAEAGVLARHVTVFSLKHCL